MPRATATSPRCASSSSPKPTPTPTPNPNPNQVRFFLERVDTSKTGDDGVAFIDRGTTKLNTTPIDRAVRCDHTAIVELLLQSGASPHVRRSSGDTQP